MAATIVGAARSSFPQTHDTARSIFADAARAAGLARSTSASCAFVVGSIVQEFVRGMRGAPQQTGSDPLTSLIGLVLSKRRKYGGYIVHLGVAVMFFGFAGKAYDRMVDRTIEKPAITDTRDRHGRPAASRSRRQTSAFAFGDYTFLYEQPDPHVRRPQGRGHRAGQHLGTTASTSAPSIRRSGTTTRATADDDGGRDQVRLDRGRLRRAHRLRPREQAGELPRLHQPADQLGVDRLLDARVRHARLSDPAERRRLLAVEAEDAARSRGRRRHPARDRVRVVLGLASQAHAAQPREGAAAEHVPAGMGMGDAGGGYAAKNRPDTATAEKAMKELICPCGCARQDIFHCDCQTAADLRGQGDGDPGRTTT